MRKLTIQLCLLAVSLLPAISSTTSPAQAESCPGNPDALGTSRTLTVEAAALPRIGKMQYKTTLPLKDHEVVITFDDGPLPPYTNRILDTLKSECVKVTYFLVGQMARAYPDTVRRIYNAGHTIGTHSQHHPLTFDQMGLPRITSEVDGGIASVQKAVGDARAVAPFFRIPAIFSKTALFSRLGFSSSAPFSRRRSRRIKRLSAASPAGLWHFKQLRSSTFAHTSSSK